jgi:hypothetical protein
MTGNNVVGYWASQEQYSMQNLLKFVAEADFIRDFSAKVLPSL